MHWSQLAAGHQDARCERGTRPILSSHTAYHIQSILNPIIQANNPADLSVSLEKLTFKSLPTLHDHIQNGTLGVTLPRTRARSHLASTSFLSSPSSGIQLLATSILATTSPSQASILAKNPSIRVTTSTTLKRRTRTAKGTLSTRSSTSGLIIASKGRAAPASYPKYLQS
jgi:hypothetical protein